MANLFSNAIISTDEICLNQPIVQIIEPVATEAEDHSARLNETIHYDQGYLAGQTATRALIEEELGQLQLQLKESLAAIPQAIAQNRLELSSEVADIVQLIVQQFFVENQKDTQVTSKQINQILTQLNNKQTVELCLHPQDIIALQNGTIQLDAAHLNGLKIKTDESLTLGGYIIKTNHGVFDAGIEKQIDKLKDVLLQLKQRGHHVPLD